MDMGLKRATRMCVCMYREKKEKKEGEKKEERKENVNR